MPTLRLSHAEVATMISRLMGIEVNPASVWIRPHDTIEEEVEVLVDIPFSDTWRLAPGPDVEEPVARAKERPKTAKVVYQTVEQQHGKDPLWKDLCRHMFKEHANDSGSRNRSVVLGILKGAGFETKEAVRLASVETLANLPRVGPVTLRELGRVLGRSDLKKVGIPANHRSPVWADARPAEYEITGGSITHQTDS